MTDMVFSVAVACHTKEIHLPADVLHDAHVSCFDYVAHYLCLTSQEISAKHHQAYCATWHVQYLKREVYVMCVPPGERR